MTRPFLTHPATTPCPDAIQPFRVASKQERLARANRVLRASRKMYRARVGPLWLCLKKADGEMASEYARQLLCSMLLENNLPGWEAHPSRKRADIYRLLDAAIRRSDMRHGGWVVAVTP